MKKTKKIIALFMLMIILLPIIQNIVLGASTTLESTKIVRGDVIKTNVKFNGYEVQARYIYYVDENNRKYPAYCISHGYDGVDERGDYTVDINGIVTNEKVWRVIINGYPYKKLDGLTNEEAYFATKQAIFCVLVEGRNANQYEGIGSKGEKIVQAIKELEYIGENGKQKYDNWNITVKTTKKLQQYKDYWYETVNISSNTDIKNFEVTKISNFPEGSFVSDEQGNPKTTFNGKESFRIMIPKSKLNQNINGTISFTTEIKTYPILVGKTRILDTQDYAITGDGYKNSLSQVSMQVELNKCNIYVNKIDGDTQEPIEGVTFELLKDGTRITTAKTNKNGQAVFSNLYQGDYQLREVETLENYVLNKELIDVYVEYGTENSKTIKNYYKTGNLKINKTDSETSAPIQGVTFQLLNLKGEEVAKGITNEKGEITFPNLKIGKYKLKEINASENYLLNTAIFDVTIEYNKTTIQNIENEYKRGSLTIDKIDKDNNKITLGNVAFDLFSYEFGKVINTYTTDVNGQLRIEGLRMGKYKLIEKIAGKWYNLAEDTQVNIHWDEMTKLVLENELKKGQIKIIKTDKENEDIRIPGVSFNILGENDELLETIITDENGEAFSKKYPIRDYENLKIQEVKTDDKYILNEDVKTVKLEDGKITQIILSNEKKKGQIEITKVSANYNPITHEKKGTLLTGATFEIYTENNELVDTIIIGENGKGMSKLLEYGNYNIKEKSTGSDNYVLNEKIYHVNIRENGKVVPITIENKSVEIPEEPKEETKIEKQKPKVETPKKLPKTGM